MRVKVCALLLPAGRNWRGLNADFEVWSDLLVFWVCSFESQVWEPIWWLQFSFRGVNLCLRPIGDKQRAVTPGLLGELSGKGGWAGWGWRAKPACCTWVSRTDLEKKGQKSHPVQKKGRTMHLRESWEEVGAGAPAQYLGASFAPLQREHKHNALNNSSGNLFFTECFASFFYQSIWISEKEQDFGGRECSFQGIHCKEITVEKLLKGKFFRTVNISFWPPA